MSKFKDFLTSLGTLRELVEQEEYAYGELTLTVLPQNLIPLCSRLARIAEYDFSQLIDITAVDYLGSTPRFVVVYHILSHHKSLRLRLKVVPEEQQDMMMVVPSLCSIYPAANWFEREVWDMYGIAFEGHPDLRRILTDYGFEGFPLRKDFPVYGTYEVAYDPLVKQVVRKPVHLVQDYREFNYSSPWEGSVPKISQSDQEKDS